MTIIQSHHLYQPKRLEPQQSVEKNRKPKASVDFGSLLHQEINETPLLKISKHAKQRLADRSVMIDSKEWQQITQKVQEAKDKGMNDSVVVTKHAALLVNAKNQTVITAMNRNEASAHLFSNIDGAIIID